MNPVRIAIGGKFAPALAAELACPHTLPALPEQDDAGIARILADTDVLVSASYKAAWRSPAGAGPRLVHSTGAGVDGIEIASLPPGCKVCNVYGHERGVAEQAFMLILALQKGLLGLDAALRRGDWTPQRPFLTELRDRHLLILGLGHIGRELARWGQFLGMSATALTRSPAKARTATPGLRAVDGLDRLGAHLPAADFVVVAIPAAPETTDLIGARELGLMKPTAFIVNVGRAAVINEAALYEALRHRRIAGAGLDVWYQYPRPGENCLPSRLPFHELDNVVMTPHKPTVETMAFRWREIAKNIARFGRGEPLENQVLP